MFNNSGLIPKTFICLLVLLGTVTISCLADSGNNSPLIDNKLNNSLPNFPEFENITLPAPPENISDVNKAHIAGDETQGLVSGLVSSEGGIQTMGNVVLVPITPTPEGSGYYYFNATGNDQSYYIYSSGTYTLQDGFSTGNSTAIYIGASDVVLEGNAQKITGNATNTGITIRSEENNTTVRNFAGVEKFYTGINSTGNQVSLINNSMCDNYFTGAILSGSNISIEKNILKNNSQSGIYLSGTDAILTDNVLNNNQEYGCYAVVDNISIKKNSFNNNYNGGIFEGNNITINENTAINNLDYGIGIGGSGIECIGNIISQNNYNIFLVADNATIKSNTLSSSNNNGFGILAMGENGTFSENTINNHAYGILAYEDNCNVRNNRVYSNTFFGIVIQGENTTVSDNIIRDTTLNGLVCHGNNSSIDNNIITNATVGVGILDNYVTSICGNQINSTSQSGVQIGSSYGRSNEGIRKIYNNYFGSDTNIGGGGNLSKYSFLWTNPDGPQLGTNVIGGPFIAGNYWSNPSGTGWSDQQTPNVSGYTTIPYNLLTGINDTAPLVPQKTVTINATANNWGIIVPGGNSSYRSYTNQTFITQAKPGAEISDVVVDSQSKGNVTNWTFTQLTEDHEIQAIGNATPGQVHAIFNASTRYGQSPLTVSFSSEQSLGSPTSWYWQFGDGISNTTQNPIHTYTTPGVYSVTLRALNNQTGGYAVWNNYITVTDGPVPEPTPTPVPGKIIAQFSAYPTTGNAPLTVDFRDMSSGNPTSWTWDFGDGAQSSIQNPSHVYTVVGTYSVTLSLKNANYGGSLRISNAITVT
ncbi:PKD domain-containing protein [Methanospirillum lacunae]|uniref:PKD domain-containing protein n=1 Tax=Methanospirillum lacunae TaxID=668570 RepID=A0A2V2N3K0_9EURY|nr:PKD domain-containing protein [Methanospirillum lacunae]PWR74744.1 hypothetical protein DK846_00400 [Methanospirillum lacunae]